MVLNNKGMGPLTRVIFVWRGWETVRAGGVGIKELGKRGRAGDKGKQRDELTGDLEGLKRNLRCSLD
jgi:hypothetical protein